MAEVQARRKLREICQLGDLQSFQALLRNRLLDDRHVEDRFLPLTRADGDLFELCTVAGFRQGVIGLWDCAYAPPAGVSAASEREVASAVRNKNERIRDRPPTVGLINDATPPRGPLLDTSGHFPWPCALIAGCDKRRRGVALPRHPCTIAQHWTLVKQSCVRVPLPISETRAVAQPWADLCQTLEPHYLDESVGVRREPGCPRPRRQDAMRLALVALAAIAAAHQNHQARLRNRAGAPLPPVRFAEEWRSRHPVNGRLERLSPSVSRREAEAYGVDSLHAAPVRMSSSNRHQARAGERSLPRQAFALQNYLDCPTHRRGRIPHS